MLKLLKICSLIIAFGAAVHLSSFNIIVRGPAHHSLTTVPALWPCPGQKAAGSGAENSRSVYGPDPSPTPSLAEICPIDRSLASGFANADHSDQGCGCRGTSAALTLVHVSTV